MVGQTISHCKVLEKVGQGGMGEVYLAQDTSLDRKVALKFLPEFLHQDPIAEKRFLREAKSAAALDHPFICHVHEDWLMAFSNRALGGKNNLGETR